MKHDRDLQNISSWGLDHKTEQRTRHGVKSLTLAASVQASNFIKVNSCYASQHVWCPLRMKTSVIAVILFGRWRRVICGLKDTQQKRCKSLQGCSADGLPKGRPFLSSKTEGREREDKGHRFIHLSRCGYVFLHTFVHETDMKCLCLVNKSCIWVSAIAFRSPPSVVSAHSRLRRFLDHLLSEWISTKHQMKVGQVALIGQRGEGVLHYTGFFFTVINIFRALHQRTNWFNAQLRVGPWLERGHSVDFKRPLASEWSFHGSQLCYASPVHFNSFDLHSWWIN